MKKRFSSILIHKNALLYVALTSVAFLMMLFFTLFPFNHAAAVDCWCRTPEGICEHHAESSGVTHCGTASDSGSALTYCNNYCASRGGGTWQAAFCDTTAFIDRTESGNGTCPREVATPSTPSGSTPSGSGAGTTPPPEPVQLYNPLGGDVTISQFIGRGIRAVIGIVGALALLMFIYGGITWMTAGGSQERVTSAKNILKNSFIGILLIFFSYTIISIFFSFLTG